MHRNNKPTPIAIFVYKRPEHTRRLLESLEKCVGFETCPIYIFSDGAKDESNEENVRGVRNIIRDFAEKHNGLLFEAPENLGLSPSIIRGIDHVLRQHDRIIVLEDDLILHPRALDFMIQSLDRYEDDQQVGHISGFSFPIQFTPADDAVLLPLFNSWGWATWARSWKDFEWAPDKALREILKDPGLWKRMYPYFDIFLYFYLINDMVWDLLWHWKLRSKKRLGVFPANSLIWCSGFDDTATHGGVPVGYQATLEQVMRAKLAETIRFPAQILLDPQAIKALRIFLLSIYGSRTRRLYRHVRDAIKVRLKRLLD